MSKIIYLGHASFLIKGSDFSFVVDPFQDDSVPNLKFPKLEEVDAVFCSHDHFDHNAKEKVRIKHNPYPVEAHTITVPHDHENGRKRGLNRVSIFNVDNYRIVHLGDIGCVLDKSILEPLKKCDVLLAPINGFFTISPDELKEIVNIVKPRILIPMHYYMKQYQSGYQDGDMIDRFKKLFPSFQSLENSELDLDKYQDFAGVLIFNKFLQ